MITIVPVTTKALQKRFVKLPYEIYKDCTQWVPPFESDIYAMMNPKKHPFYDHSVADFFLAIRDGKDVGRIAALENKPFNTYHGAKDGEFYLFESVNDQEVADALFNTVADWARVRGLTKLVGPKGFGPLDGYGIQIEGYEHRQMMNMMNYNLPYYRDLVENYGFTKAVDFVSSYVNPRTIEVPEKIAKAVQVAEKRGTLKIKNFKNKTELKKWVPQIRKAYNNAFVQNWEYYPLSERELDFVVSNVLILVIPELLQVILKNGEIVGFVLPFPDVSAAMQKNKGKLGPIELIRLLREIKRTNWIDFNGIGIIPEAQGCGGNALLYDILIKTVHADQRFEHSEFTQVAETAVQMRKDLANLGVRFYKNHRVYQKELD
ncbi:MAG: hypothetical protein WA116_07770 [Anaerolineaceae bacterium]